MKKVFLVVVISATTLFFACKKEGQEKVENHCPVVSESYVPQIVKDSFAVRYPATTVKTWFNKDSVAFCAYFITSTKLEKLVHFDNIGNFIKEEIESHQEGQYQDSTGTGVKWSGGCKCEPEHNEE